jgi:hypothetical protein
MPPRCRKNKILTEQLARQAAARQTKTPKRPYYCEICRAWHLTSKPK